MKAAIQIEDDAASFLETMLASLLILKHAGA